MAIKQSQLTDEFVRQLAREYLHSGQTMESIATKYDSSRGTISNILYNGIVDGKIDNITSEAIICKVIRNTRPFERVKTRRHWEKTTQLRLVKEAKEEIIFLKKKLEELSFKLDTYDAYFFDEESAPSRESIQREISNIQMDIHAFETFLRGAENE